MTDENPKLENTCICDEWSDPEDCSRCREDQPEPAQVLKDAIDHLVPTMLCEEPFGPARQAEFILRDAITDLYYGD